MNNFNIYYYCFFQTSRIALVSIKEFQGPDRRPNRPHITITTLLQLFLIRLFLAFLAYNYVANQRSSMMGSHWSPRGRESYAGEGEKAKKMSVWCILVSGLVFGSLSQVYVLFYNLKSAVISAHGTDHAVGRCPFPSYLPGGL